MYRSPAGNALRTPEKSTKLAIKSPKKGRTIPSTVSPVSTPSEARKVFPSREAEATAIYKKGLENLELFKILRKDVKQEIKKVLDRLFLLAKSAPAIRNLQDELESDGACTNINKTATQAHSNEGQVIKKLEKNHRLLSEQGRKLDELRSLMGGQKETLQKATYAAVTSAEPKANLPSRPKELHSVVVTSKNEMDTGEEVLERVRKTVDAKEGWIKVKRVRKAKDRKIIVGCETKEERKQIKKKLERAGAHLVLEEMENKDPLLVLKDVLLIHSDDDVLRALRNQNRVIFQDLDKEMDKMKIKYRKRSRNPQTGHIILEVSPTIWRRATDARKMRVNLQHVWVEDQSPLVQCSKCLGYGHGRRFCGDPEDLCSHCGGPHLHTACPGLESGEPPECLKFKRSKLDNRAHNTFSRDCPVRRSGTALREPPRPIAEVGLGPRRHAYVSKPDTVLCKTSPDFTTSMAKN